MVRIPTFPAPRITPPEQVIPRLRTMREGLAYNTAAGAISTAVSEIRRQQTNLEVLADRYDREGLSDIAESLRGASAVLESAISSLISKQVELERYASELMP